jgi:hypothetical protein
MASYLPTQQIAARSAKTRTLLARGRGFLKVGLDYPQADFLIMALNTVVATLSNYESANDLWEITDLTRGFNGSRSSRRRCPIRG